MFKMAVIHVIIAFFPFETVVQNAVYCSSSESNTSVSQDERRPPTAVQFNDDASPSPSTSTTVNYENRSLESELKAEIQKKSKQITEILESLLSKGYTFTAIKKAVKIDFSTLNATAYPEDEYELVKFMLNAQLGLHEMDEFRAKVLQLHPSENREHGNLSVFNNGVLAVGVSKFVSIAAQFCECEGQRGKFEIVSVGSGDGVIEKRIMAEYRDRVGHDLNITLVDPDPQFRDKVDFELVADLIEKRPHVVGDCVLLVIWPEPPGRNDNYDIDALLELRPRAALTLYEMTGSSGSNDFCKFLLNDNDLRKVVSPTEFGFFNWMAEYQLHCRRDREDYYGLEGNYAMEEVMRQKLSSGPLSGTSVFRIVKLKRI